MQHPRGIANATRIHGHLDDLLLHGRRLTSISIRQEKCPPVLWARTAPIPLLALPRHAMSHTIRAVTVEAVQYLKNHESTLSRWSFSASHPRIKDSRSTPLEHLPRTDAAPAKRGSGRPPQAAASLEQLAQDAQAASQEFERISAQREQVAQSIRHLGQAYHFVD